MKLVVLLTDGFADWEVGLLTAEARRSADAEVKYLAAHAGPIHSMGGLRIGEIESVFEVDIHRFSALVVPGAARWEEDDSDDVPEVLKRAYDDGLLVGAVCAGTIPLARSGLLHQRSHTSNGHDYLAKHIPDFDEDASYRKDLCVRDGRVITASGLGYVEFAAEMLEALDILSDDQRTVWYELFKDGNAYHRRA